jgi:hypothetical protein
MKSNLSIKSVMLILLLSICSTSFADEASDAKVSAEKIIDLMSESKYSVVWDSYMSDFFRSKITKDSFLANMKLGRQMLGQRKSKELIDRSNAAGDPASGYTGAVYAFNYKNAYSTISLYERVVVINQDGKGFKLAGFFAQPVQ